MSKPFSGGLQIWQNSPYFHQPVFCPYDTIALILYLQLPAACSPLRQVKMYVHKNCVNNTLESYLFIIHK